MSIQLDAAPYSVLSITNKATGGSIGSAASTIDIYRVGEINQTTAGQNVTFANPTSTTVTKYFTLANIGTAGVWAYGRFIRPGSSHTFMWSPGAAGWRRTSSSPQIIAQSGAAVTAPADTNKNVLFSIALPASVVGANGVIEVTTLWGFTGSTNAKTLDVTLGSTAFYQSAITTGTTVLAQACTIIRNRNSESSQVCTNIGSSGFGGAVVAATTGTEDTSAAITLYIYGTKASAGETLRLDGYTVEIKRFD